MKAIVIACNTATAYGLEDIRKTIESLGIPVIVVGVVEAGARGVLEELPRSNDPPIIAVLATTGTCSSGAYPRAIGNTLGLAGRRNPIVIQQGSVGWQAQLKVIRPTSAIRMRLAHQTIRDRHSSTPLQPWIRR